MVGRCIPYWNSPFLGDMLVFRGVIPRSLSRLVIGWISAVHWLPAVHNGPSDWRQLHPIQIPGSRSPVLGNKILWILGKKSLNQKTQRSCYRYRGYRVIGWLSKYNQQKRTRKFCWNQCPFWKIRLENSDLCEMVWWKISNSSTNQGDDALPALRTTNQGFAWKLMFFSIQVDLFVQTLKIDELRCKKSLIPSTSIY